MQGKQKYSGFIIAVVITACLTQGYWYARDRVLYGLIKRRVCAYVFNRYRVRCSIGRVSGTLFTGVTFHEVALEGLRFLPAGVVVKAARVHIAYTLADIFNRMPQIGIEQMRVCYGGLELPATCVQRADTLLFAMQSAPFYIDRVRTLLPIYGDLYVDGLGVIQAQVLIKRFHLEIFTVVLDTENTRFAYGTRARGQVKAHVVVRGGKSFIYPRWSGSIALHSAEYFLTAEERRHNNTYFNWIRDTIGVDISLTASALRLVRESADVTVNAQLRLRKNPGGKPLISGDITSAEGTCVFRGKRFTVQSSRIALAPVAESEPVYHIRAATRFGRYRLTLTVAGSPSDMRFDVDSFPFLSKQDAYALLMFGKRVSGLDAWEKQQVDSRGPASLFVSGLLFGQAQEKLAAVVGLDDISFLPGLRASGSSAPSVLLGKYLVGDYVYGTYGVQAARGSQQQIQQTIGGELFVAHNISLRGERLFNTTVGMPLEDKISVEFKWDF